MAKLLVIEDEQALLDAYVAVLTRASHVVTKCSNGEDAIIEIEKDKYDIIITDLRMPGLSGRGLIEALRGSERNAHAPMIISSGFISDLHIDNSMSVGNLHFLPKPFKGKDLLGKIQQILDDINNKPTVDDKFIGLVIEATVHTLTTMVGTKTVPGTPYKKKEGEVSGDISAIVNASSSAFRGNISISMEELAFSALVSKILMIEVVSTESEAKDAVAELLNIIFGRVKMQLNATGMDFKSDIPSIVTGKNHCIEHKSAYLSMVVPFTCEGYGDVRIEVCAHR